MSFSFYKNKITILIFFAIIAASLGLFGIRHISHMSNPNNYLPETFFTGHQLQVGEAIHEANLKKVQQLLLSTDILTLGKHNISLLRYAMNQAIPEQNNADSVRFKIISALVKGGASVIDKITPDDGGSLEMALAAKSPYFLKALLDGGLNPNTLIDGEQPILFEVANDDKLTLLELLVSRGADVNIRDSLGNTAIFDPSGLMQIKTVKYLLEHDAKTNVVNKLGVSYGWTLKSSFESADINNPYTKQMMNIREQLVKSGKLKWPPDPPLVERDRMRAHGIEPIVPVGHDR